MVKGQQKHNKYMQDSKINLYTNIGLSLKLYKCFNNAWKKASVLVFWSFPLMKFVFIPSFTQQFSFFSHS